MMLANFKRYINILGEEKGSTSCSTNTFSTVQCILEHAAQLYDVDVYMIVVTYIEEHGSDTSCHHQKCILGSDRQSTSDFRELQYY